MQAYGAPDLLIYCMKRLTIYIITFCSAVYAQSPVSLEDHFTHKISMEEKKGFMKMNRKENTSGASGNFRVTYYRCEWQVDPALPGIAGKVTSYLNFTSAASQVIYDLSGSLTVDSIKNKNVLLDFHQSGNTLEISFSEEKARGETDSVSIYYHGNPASTGFGSFVTSSHSGVPVLWTLSEPYGARDWWPCRNGLDDKADSIDVFITAPASYTAVSNGLRQSEIISGDRKTTHWKHRYPIATYLVCIAVTNYEEFNNEVQIGNIPLLMQSFCYPESVQLFRDHTPMVLEAMQLFSSLFGPYPFIKEKYGHVQFGWGGGQEHQTSTFIVTPDQNLMAHELAHQWFGDKVTCASWQHIWLNEGFATFLASLYMEKAHPETVTDTRKNEIVTITSRPDGSVFVADTTNSTRIFDSRLTYTKGSHLLYMLRWILGDSAFYAGVNHYLNDPALAYGFAYSADLQRHLEAASGKKLDDFFRDWLYGQGYPSYHIQWTPLGNDFVQIRINQTTSDASVSFFALPVPLLFKNADRQATVVIDNTKNGENFIQKIGFTPDTLIVDPEYVLITKDNTTEKVSDDIDGKNRVQIYPNPFGRTIRFFLRKFTAHTVYLRIYDIKGRLVARKSLPIDVSLLYEWELPELANGVYIAEVTSGDGFSFAQKIVKQ